MPLPVSGEHGPVSGPPIVPAAWSTPQVGDIVEVEDNAGLRRFVVVTMALGDCFTAEALYWCEERL